MAYDPPGRLVLRSTDVGHNPPPMDAQDACAPWSCKPPAGDYTTLYVLGQTAVSIEKSGTNGRMALALVVVVEPAKREGSGHRDAQTFDPLPADPDVYTHAATYTQQDVG